MFPIIAPNRWSSNRVFARRQSPRRYTLRVLRVGTLPCREVTIQFRHVLEDCHAGQRFHDLKDLLDLGLQIDERGLTAPFLEHLAGRGKHPKPGTADEFQLRQVEHDVLDGSTQHRRQLAFEVRRGGRVEAANKFHGDGAGALTADVFLDLNFEWHSNDWFLCNQYVCR